VADRHHRDDEEGPKATSVAATAAEEGKSVTRADLFRERSCALQRRSIPAEFSLFLASPPRDLSPRPSSLVIFRERRRMELLSVAASTAALPFQILVDNAPSNNPRGTIALQDLLPAADPRRDPLGGKSRGISDGAAITWKRCSRDNGKRLQLV